LISLSSFISTMLIFREGIQWSSPSPRP
jgi:hypothetical protein